MNRTPVAARIAALRRELEQLEQQQRQELLAVILLRIGPGVVFSARDLFDHQRISPELCDAFNNAGITSARKLGKRLQQLCGNKRDHVYSLARIGVEHGRALWVVTH